MNLIDYLRHEQKWSEETFGPGKRSEGIIAHIRKELLEIEDNPNDLIEWIDVIILAFDGAWREGYSAEEVVTALQEKQAINESREWPDWRTVDPNKPIEHRR